MNEEEVMALINSIDDDLVDKKIDEILNEKGENINMDSIKEKAMNKLNEGQVRKSKIKKRVVIAAAIAATLTFSTVYAGEISKVIQSFFGKSIVYSTVVDGDAYYLPEEVKLNDRFTLLNVSVSKGNLEMTVKASEKLGDKKTEGLNIAVIPMNNENVRYSVGGYGGDEDGAMYFSFMNETENNYNILPFKDFKFMIDGASYDISLAKAEGLNIDENLIVGKSENVDMDEPASETAQTQSTKIIANVAGSIKEKDGVTNIQLVAGFDDPELKLRTLGERDSTEFINMFENNGTGVIMSGGGSMTKPILAYDQDNNPYTLEIPENTVGRPVTTFETSAEPGTNLTVKLPAIIVGYEKQVESLSLEIPKEGEVVIDKELDFIIQKAIVKSIKRISEDTAVVVFELNTGGDRTVLIEDMGAYSKDVIKANTVIKGNIATMTLTFDKNIEIVDFSFDWPSYTIQGNWSIELGKSK